MPVTISLTQPSADNEVIDVDVWDDGTGIRQDVYIICEATPNDDDVYPEIVKGVIYADVAAPVPAEPPGDAEELWEGVDTYEGYLSNAPCGKFWPLPQFKVAVWAGYYDPMDPAVINWVANDSGLAYGHCVSYM